MSFKDEYNEIYDTDGVKKDPAREYTGYSLESDREDFEYVTGELERLEQYLCRYLAATGKADSRGAVDSPFYNNGARFENDVFHAWAYKWEEEPWEFLYTPDEYRELYPDYIHDNENNFCHAASGTRISWYKNFKRGTYIHGAETRNIVKQKRFGEIIDECIDSLVLEDGRSARDLPEYIAPEW